MLPAKRTAGSAGTYCWLASFGVGKRPALPQLEVWAVGLAVEGLQILWDILPVGFMYEGTEPPALGWGGAVTLRAS